MNAYVKTLCIFLMLFQATTVPGLAAQDSEDLSTWQIDTITGQQSAYAQNGFREWDVAYLGIDIPQMWFPLEIKELEILWASPYSSVHHVATRILFYGSDGYVHYILEGAVMTPGINRIRLAVECQQCRVIFNEGTIGIGVQYIGEFENPLSEHSNHVVTDDTGCWTGFSWIWDSVSENWYDACALGLGGNFAVRVKYDSLCPERLGDMDGDWDIHTDDYALFAPLLSGPTEIVTDARVYGDMTGERSKTVDLRDFAVFQSNFGRQIVCANPDLDGDLDVDLDDYAIFAGCLNGPDAWISSDCHPADFDHDTDVDLCDFAWFQEQFGGSQFAASYSRESCETHLYPAQGYHSDAPFPDLGPTDPVDPGRFEFTYMNIIIVASIVGVLAAIIGTCVIPACRQFDRGVFMADGSYPDSTELSRIREALDRISELSQGLDDEFFCWQWYSTHGAYDSHIFGTIKVHRLVSEDDTQYLACTLNGKVVLHNTIVTGDRWDRNGIDGIAIILFAEWQHISNPGWTESEAQEDFMLFRERHGFVDLMREFGHGFGD